MMIAFCWTSRLILVRGCLRREELLREDLLCVVERRDELRFRDVLLLLLLVLLLRVIAQMFLAS